MIHFLSIMTLLLLLMLASFSYANEGGKEKDYQLFAPLTVKTELNKRPEMPKNLSPEFFSKVSGESVVLKWSKVEGVESYQIQIAKDVNFWSMTVNQTINSTEYSLSDLKPGERYYWRVASVKPENNSSFTKSNFARSMFLK